MKRLAFLLTALLLASALLAPAQAPGTYTTIDFPGAMWTDATGIDTAGDVVGFFGDTDGHDHGFLLSGGLYTQLDCPGAAETVAMGINDVGQVVGGTDNDLGIFVYDISAQTYTTYAFGVGAYSAVTGAGINDAGVVVGWALDLSTGQLVGLELRNSTFKIVGISGAPSTQLTAINNAGTIVALAGKSGRFISYLYSGGTFKQIVVPGQPSAYAAAINDSNVLAGDYFPRAPRASAFEWQRMGLFKPINEPQQPHTSASAINGLGQVVGYYYDISPTQAHGFVWTPPAADKK
jgi:uncharacterized membrane protein